MKVRKVTIIFILAFISLQANGEITGNELYQRCISDKSYFYSYCMGYIQGAAHGMPNYARASGGKPNICIPSDVTTLQLIEVFKKKVRKFPELSHRPASLILAVTLSESFSCN